MKRVPASVRLTELVQRVRSIDPQIIDVVLGTLFVATGLLGLLGTGTDEGLREPDAWSLFLTLAASAPYFLRRRAPLAVLVVTTVPVVTLTVSEYPTGALPSWLLVGLYTVACYTSRGERLAGAVTVAIGLAVVAVLGAPTLNGADIVLQYAFFAAAYFAGTSVRNRRLYAEELEARAAALERERDEEAKRAVADERLRIAQELHDVVAHSMGVIAVQAGVGAHVIDTDPAEAKRSLEAISQTSRSTLTEIRRMLGVLRDDGAHYVPAPGLADLDRLVREVAGTGVDVDLHVDGDRGALPPGVDLTAYRIVQEALTNVLKHAGPARVQVRIGYEPDAVALEVADDGCGVNGRATGGGHGLLGMRERVGVYGGDFEAGPRPGGGFRVRVRLPYGAPE